MKKKLLALLMASTMVFGLVACGSTEETASAGAAETTETTETTESADTISADSADTATDASKRHGLSVQIHPLSLSSTQMMQVIL